MSLSLPPPTQPITYQSGMVTEPWYRVFGEITRLRTELDALKRLTQGMGAMDSGVSFTATFVGST
jgi:hypothetical protein